MFKNKRFFCSALSFKNKLSCWKTSTFFQIFVSKPQEIHIEKSISRIGKSFNIIFFLPVWSHWHQRRISLIQVWYDETY